MSELGTTVLLYQQAEAWLTETCLLWAKDCTESTVRNIGSRILDSGESCSIREAFLEKHSMRDPSLDFPTIGQEQLEKLLPCQCRKFLHLDARKFSVVPLDTAANGP